MLTRHFDTQLTLDEAWIPNGEQTDFFPIGDGTPDKHQAEMMELLFNSDCEAVVNTNMTGSGKTLSWCGPVIRSPEYGDPWIVMATYPTKALVEDQRDAIIDLFRQYYQSTEYSPQNGFELVVREDGTEVLTDGPRTYPLTDRVIELTSDSTRGQNTSDVMVAGYEEAVAAYQDGLPTIFLTTPDTLTLLASNRFSNNDAVGIPGLVNMIVVDEFHLSNPRAKRLLPFHLDVFFRLSNNNYLEKLVYLSATPVESYVDRITHAFDTETVSRTVHQSEPPIGGRKILPETTLHVTSQPMFTNGQWLANHVDDIREFYTSDGQMVIILDSVREVEDVATALERETDLDIGRIYGWKRTGREHAVRESDILVGNTAVEVGVDFEQVNRLIFTAYDANSTIQRLGRMRNSESLTDFQAAIITHPEAHNRLIDTSTNGRIQREDLESVLYKTLDESESRPYYDVLCAAYARYLWEDADGGWGVSPLNEMYLPERLDPYQQMVHRHFSPAVSDLSGDSPGVTEFWQYLDEIKENYRASDGTYPVFEELHTYRPSSLSCVVIDAADPDEPVKNYGLHYVLRYCNGRVVADADEAREAFQSIYDREMTDSETEFFEESGRYACGYFVSHGTINSPRDYWVADYTLLDQERTNWENGPQFCEPTVMQQPVVRTDPPVQGTDQLNVSDESVLAQFVGLDSETARSQFSLGAYASAVPVGDSETLLLWQDGILAHSTIMSTVIQGATSSTESESTQSTLDQHT